MVLLPDFDPPATALDWMKFKEIQTTDCSSFRVRDRSGCGTLEKA